MTRSDAKQIKQAAEMLRVVAHPLRLALLQILERGERNVTELQDELKRPQAVVSQHLKVMRSGGIVAARREGTRCLYHIQHPAIQKLLECVRSQGRSGACVLGNQAVKKGVVR